MKISLAPMEGVVDYPMRQLLTSTGGFDLCVTEFIRVTNTLYPASVFYRLCPELHHGCQTLSGTPVHLQLMGNDPQLLAENACKAAELGARGIDLNFGCPAKTVNRHKGGAALLKEPELIYDVVRSVRQQVPETIPVTAKMRLGFDSPDRALDIALGIESAGAGGITIHARTKAEGYKPPAHWHLLAPIRKQLAIPLTANGEIWTVTDSLNCRSHSGCEDIMIGRGALARPSLASEIKALHREQPAQACDSWPATRELIQTFAENVLVRQDIPENIISNPERYLTDRLKQWLRMISKQQQQASALLERVKRLQNAQDILSELQAA